MQTEQELRKQTVLDAARHMMAAARTAPKGRGIDVLHIALLSDIEVQLIAKQMKQIAVEKEQSFFERDANNILIADAVIIIAAEIKTIGLQYCNTCGHVNCQGKSVFSNTPCAFNLIDLGIAIGSAVGVASNLHIDNRIMYSIGKAIRDLNIMPEEVKVIIGIPLSVSAKNPFFDRK